MSTKEVQTLLKQIGFPIKVDGVRGGKTVQAIKDFQRGYVGAPPVDPLLQDGLVGPKTEKALRASAAKNGLCSEHFRFKEFASSHTGAIRTHRELVIEWRDVAGFACASSETVTFEVVFFEGSNRVLFNYADPMFGGSCSFGDRGASATIGIQQSGSVSRQFSFNVASVDAGTALAWSLAGGAPAPFTDDPLVTGSTAVKAVHFAELRTRIDALRARFGLGGFAWTDSSLTGATIKGVHLTELRTAISQAYTAAGMLPPAFTDDVSPGVLLVRRTLVEELRSAVTALEAF